MSLRNFLSRFGQSPDPQEPATPPPFAMGDRVITSPRSGVLGHGEVAAVEFTTDREDPFGPWVVSVLLDPDRFKMAFHAAELTLELLPPLHLDDCVVVPLDTPLFDDVTSEAMARDGLAAEVEGWLSRGGAS